MTSRGPNPGTRSLNLGRTSLPTGFGGRLPAGDEGQGCLRSGDGAPKVGGWLVFFGVHSSKFTWKWQRGRYTTPQLSFVVLCAVKKGTTNRGPGLSSASCPPRASMLIWRSVHQSQCRRESRSSEYVDFLRGLEGCRKKHSFSVMCDWTPKVRKTKGRGPKACKKSPKGSCYLLLGPRE